MSKRFFAIMLSASLLYGVFGSTLVRAQAGKDGELAQAARAKVQTIGVGPKARVEVKLRDRTKLKGYVTAARDDSFTVTNLKTGVSQVVAYSEVAQVKKPSGGLSTRTWVILGAVAAAVVVVGIVVKPAFCDGGAQTRFPC